MAMSTPDLPLALKRVLTEIPDIELQEHIENVFGVAARAINQLRDLDLTQYELETADDDQNLEMLEHIAPVLAATVVDVIAVVRAVSDNFPENQPLTSGDPDTADRAERAVEILRTRSRALHTEVMQLGIQLRSPRAVADRWNFLNHLQTARGRLRWGIGEMVADAASVYAEVAKAAVIPEYQVDIDMAVSLRRTLNRFALGLRGQLGKIEAGTSQSLTVLLTNLSGTMDTLAKTKTWRELRAPDKKEFVKFRAQLRTLAAPGAKRGETLDAIKGFLSFLELLAAVLNQRETLRTHDHACLAELTAQLERMEQLAPGERAGGPMAKVVSTCERLVGRDDDLDRFFHGLKASPEGTSEQIAELREHAQRLLMQ